MLLGNRGRWKISDRPKATQIASQSGNDMSELNSKTNGIDQANIAAGNHIPTGRRRFVRGVGVAIPVVLSVASRSALATQCLSPSASASISLLHSRPDRPRDGRCAGGSPGYWGNASTTHPGQWAQAGAEGKLFSSIFPGGYPGKTLKEVIGLNGTADPFQLGAHLAAAWCNLRMGWVAESVLNLDDLVAMWNGRAGYSPVAGAPLWNAEDIVTYLKTTMNR